MPQSPHSRIAELHNYAAHAHAAAAASHNRNDHASAHEQSAEARAFSLKAHEESVALSQEGMIPPIPAPQAID